MPGTLTAKFKEEMARAHVEPFVYVQITLTVPNTRYVALSTAHSSDYYAGEGILADPIIISITDVAQEIDPIKRNYQISTLQIEILNDAKIRTLMASHSWFNATVLVTLGTVNMIDSGDFETIFYGRVERVYADFDKITVDVTTKNSKIENFKSRKFFSSKHPLEVLKTTMNDAGIVDGDIDTATFASDVFATLSHHCFSSYGFEIYQGLAVDDDTGYPNSAPDSPYTTEITSSAFLGANTYGTLVKIFPKKFGQEYCELAGISLINGSASKIKAVQPDPAAAVTKHLTIDEYYNFEQDPEALIFNRVDLKFGPGRGGEEMSFKDAASITKYGERTYEKNIFYFANAAQPFATNSGSGVNANDATLGSFGVNGFCGARSLKAGQAAADRIDAGNPFYGFWRSGIYKTTTPHTDPIPAWDAREFEVDDLGAFDATILNSCAQIRLSGLALLGGEDYVNSNSGYYYDITIGYQFAERLLERFSNTAPKISFTLGLEHMDLEISDVVSIDNDWFVAPELGLDGLDSDVKFEITKKEVRAAGSDIGIDFEAVYLTHSSALTVTTAIIAPPIDGMLPLSTKYKRSIDAQSSCSNAIDDGYTVTHTSGLNVSIAAGEAIGGGQLRVNQTALVIACTASKDNYVGLDLNTGSVLVYAAALNAVEPALQPNEIRLAKIVTDGSAVTSAVDLRSFGSITPRQLNRTLLQPANGILWNGGFEQWSDTGFDATGWGQTTTSAVINTDYQRDATVAHTGRYCLQMNNTSASISLISDFIRIDNTTPYRVSLWCREKSNIAQRVDLEWHTETKAAASTANVNITNASCAALNTWEMRSTIVTPGSDVAYARLVLKRPSSPGGDCYFDDITINPEKPSFSVYGAATVAPGTKGVFQVKFDNESHDFGGNYDHSGSDYDFEAPRAGTYEFSSKIEGVYVGSFSYLLLMIYKNGAVLKSNYGTNRTVSSLVGFASVETGPVVLAKGDLITVQMHPEIQTSYTLATGAHQTYFSGRQIS